MGFHLLVVILSSLGGVNRARLESYLSLRPRLWGRSRRRFGRTFGSLGFVHDHQLADISGRDVLGIAIYKDQMRESFNA